MRESPTRTSRNHRGPVLENEQGSGIQLFFERGGAENAEDRGEKQKTLLSLRGENRLRNRPRELRRVKRN